MPRYPRLAPSAVGLSDTVFSQLVAKARSRGGEVFPLHVGDTWLDPLPSARSEAQRSTDHPRLHNYAPVQGEPALLDAIERHLLRRSGIRRDRSLVQVMSGATPAFGIVSDALLDPGDEVLLPSPFWPLIRGTLRRRGAVPVEIPFYTRLSDPLFDPESALESSVTPRTVAVYVNTPNNPSGAVLDERSLSAISRVAARHQLWILCDEVYEDLWYTDSPPPSPWARPDFIERSVAVHSVSKAYGLAGARVGFAHGPPEAMEAVRGVQTFTTYCAPRPMQLGAARVLDDGSQWISDARSLYRDAGRLAAEALGVAPPEGGTFLFVDSRPHLCDGESTLGFLERCLDAGVLLTPGSASGRDYDSWVRLCFTSVPPEALSQALDRLRPLFVRRD